jgi:release factor glutamine methyltransferase
MKAWIQFYVFLLLHETSMPETQPDVWSNQRLLEWTTDHFKKAGAESARLEAEILLAESLGCQRIELYTRYNEVPPADEMAQFRAWVKRRAAGEPVAYIVGYREFYSLRFDVNANVLIPRPETEHLVVAALEAAKDYDGKPLRVIDVGTGSGCVAIAMAKHLDRESVIGAIDLSPDAIAVAYQNALKHEVDGKIKFFTGDLLEALPAGSNPVHLIVSNPPYIGHQESDTVEDQVKNFEPSMALFAGDKGTEIIERLIAQSVPMLLPKGQLLFETSPSVMDACVNLVESQDGLELVEIIKDLAGLKRIVVARKS